ncbi:hypothetical protein BOX37_12445 [Nocardia mangyaensis]|uniref:Uncharacterized protein n=1 Tax=Nocardia mangyaensis TaxID=2213200 RepID=A0A1J0VRG3_9NOCA|nr:hypothetical protein BOX37_12445 [Nocardia mangyaensis]
MPVQDWCSLVPATQTGVRVNRASGVSAVTEMSMPSTSASYQMSTPASDRPFRFTCPSCTLRPMPSPDTSGGGITDSARRCTAVVPAGNASVYMGYTAAPHQSIGSAPR